jgi:phage shock protein C
MEPKKLFRSQTNSVIAGVCGGLAEYFDIDPVLVRVIFVLLLLFGGGGLLIYIILWIVTPQKPISFDSAHFAQFSKDNPETAKEPGQEETNEPKTYKYRGSMIGGVILVTLGILFLLDEFIPHLDFGRLWPVLLIIIGTVLIGNTINRNKK